MEVVFNQRHLKTLSLGQAGDSSCDIKRIVFFQGFHHAATDLAGGSRDENFEGHANERKLMRV